METTRNAAVEEKVETATETAVQNQQEQNLTERQERSRETAIQLEKLAQQQMQAYRFPEAIETLHQAITHYRKIGDQPAMANCQYWIGSCYEQQQKYSEAIRNYLEVKRVYKKLENLKDYGIVADRLAKTYFYQGDSDKAIEEYRSAIEEGCEDSEIFNNLGFLLIDEEEYESARENLKKAVELREKEDNTELHLAYNNLGVIEFLLGNYKEAVKLFETGVEKDLRKPEDDRTIQYQVFAKPTYKGESFAERKIFKDVNTKSSLKLNLAGALAMDGDIKGAMEHCESALSMDQDRAYLYESAGWLYLSAKEEKRAAEYFRRAMPFDPSDDSLKRLMNLINPYINAKVGRNDPCPCGSGKKFKKCHGSAV